MSKVKVIFRKWKNNGDIIALFPLEPDDYQGRYCASFEHVGQHGGASPLIVGDTKPTTKREYSALYKELRRLGYRLEVIQRMPHNALATRRARLWTDAGLVPPPEFDSRSI